MANYTYNVSSYSSYGSLYYSFSGNASGLNPNISANVSSGDTLTFNVSSAGHPFNIKTALGSGSSNAYNTGVTNNGTQSGTVVLTVSDSTPTTLYYQCGVHYGMNGQINLNLTTTTTSSTTTTTTAAPTTTTTSTTTTTTTTASPTTTTTTTGSPTTSTTTTTTTGSPTTSTTTTTTTDSPTTTTTTSTTNTTPAPTTTTTTPDPSVSTTPKPDPSVTASLEVVGDNLEITFNPINFTSQSNTKISWFLSNGSVLSSADGPYTAIFDPVLLSVITGYKYTIPLSRFAVEFAEYTFTITSSDDTDSASTVLRWTSPGTPTTTTTTTTTDSPLDIVIETNDLIECPCGEIKFPKGGHYYPRDKNMSDTSTDFVDIDPVFGTQNTLYGLRVLVKEGSTSKDYGLIHSDVIYLKSEDKFVTVTDTIEDQITPDKLALYIDLDGFYRMNLENVITVTVQDEVNKKTLGHKSFGAFGSRQKIARSSLIDKPSLVLNLTGTTNLYKNSLIITVQSNCHYDRKPCCDRLPQIMRVTNSGDALYGKVGSGVCIPLDSFYTGEQINYSSETTTTPHPDSVTFVKDLTVDIGEGEATLSSQIKSYYDSDIKYWWELTNTDCLTKLTTLQTAKSNEEISFTDTRIGDATYRIRVISPEIKFSNSVSVVIPGTTTTTTSGPTITTTTTTTTVDPSTRVIFNIYQQGGAYPRHWDSEFNRLIRGNGLPESLGYSNMDELIDPSNGSGSYGERWFTKSEDLANPAKTNNVRYSAPFGHFVYANKRTHSVRRPDYKKHWIRIEQTLGVLPSIQNPVGQTIYDWYFIDLMAEGGVYIPTLESSYKPENMNWKYIPTYAELLSDSFDENGDYIKYPYIQLKNTGTAEQRLAMIERTTINSNRGIKTPDENGWIYPADSRSGGGIRYFLAISPTVQHNYIDLPDIYKATSYDRLHGLNKVGVWSDEVIYNELGAATQSELYPFLRRFLIRCVASNNGVSATSQTLMISNAPLFDNYFKHDPATGGYSHSLCKFNEELNTIESFFDYRRPVPPCF